MAKPQLTCLSCYNSPYISPSISSSSYHIQNFFQVFTFSLHEICYFLYVMYSTHHKKFNFCLSFPSQKKFPESSILLHLTKYRLYGRHSFLIPFHSLFCIQFSYTHLTLPTNREV